MRLLPVMPDLIGHLHPQNGSRMRINLPVVVREKSVRAYGDETRGCDGLVARHGGQGNDRGGAGREADTADGVSGTGF